MSEANIPPSRPIIRDWIAQRSGARITIKGTDYLGRPLTVTGIVAIEAAWPWPIATERSADGAVLTYALAPPLPPDEAIDTSDIPEATAEQMAGMTLVNRVAGSLSYRDPAMPLQATIVGSDVEFPDGPAKALAAAMGVPVDEVGGGRRRLITSRAEKPEPIYPGETPLFADGRAELHSGDEKWAAVFSVLLTDGALRVVDANLPGRRTVTNDAERVIARLRAAGYDLGQLPVIYRDSTGKWDRLVVQGGAFAGYDMIRGESFEHALRLYRARAF